MRKIGITFCILSLTLLVWGSGPSKGGGTYLGTDPGHGRKEAGRPESLSGSTVAFTPASGGETCWMPGSSQTFYFTTDSYTTDWGYVYTLWLSFPSDWTVTNVAVSGTPVCTGGSWGTFSWAPGTTPNVAVISHPRYQSTTDHCTAIYAVTVTAGAAGPDAPVSWFWDGDGYGSAPYNPCSSDGYTPAGQSDTCDESTNPPASIPACILTGVILSASPAAQTACTGSTVTYPFTLMNYTGAAATFGITHAGNAWTVAHTATVGPVANGASASFNLTHDIPFAAAPGATDTVSVTATDQANPATTASKSVTTTATDTGSWTTVAASAPGWMGSAYPCDGCTALNGSGQWVTYIIGDTAGSGLAGFWGYNHATNAWFNPGAAGTPADRWAPSWAYDPATNLCYLTGGANTPGGGNFTEAYVYNPVGNAFTALPSFTTARDFHAAWVGSIDGTKYLAIGGGVNAAGTYFSSTQSYNLSTLPGAWDAENALLGALPVIKWGAADGVIAAPTGSQFWIASGADSGGALTDSAHYFDDADNAWHAAGNTGSVVYRTTGVVSGSDFYLVGGSTGGFTPTNAVRRYRTGTWTAMPNMPHSRMDLVAGAESDGSIWVVDGYGSATSAYVDVFAPCGACPTITLTPATLPNGDVGTAYSQTFGASGGTGPYSFALSLGTFPPGLALDGATGILSGTPTAAGVYVFTVTATDSTGCGGFLQYTVVICQVLTVAPATLPGGSLGLAYSATVSASGGTAPYTYAVTAGALPAGLTLDPNTGVISGTPTVGGTFNVTITATDANGCSGSQAYALVLGTYDVVLFDDYGRAKVCINTASGAWSWTILRGLGTGTMYTGVGNLTNYNGTITIVSPPGQPLSVSIKYLARYHKGSGTFTNRPLRILSTIYDNNTLNNPPCI